MENRNQFVVVSVVQGEGTGHVLKSHLESEGIPTLLKYESAGPVYGLTVDGLGMVMVLVPAAFADDARQVVSMCEGSMEATDPLE